MTFQDATEIEAYVAEMIELTGPMASWKLSVLGNQRPYLQISGEGIDHDTLKPVKWSGRKHWLSLHMTRNEIVRTAWNACVGAMLHEMQECFYYNGARVFDPHMDYDALAFAMLTDQIGKDVRPDSMNGA